MPEPDVDPGLWIPEGRCTVVDVLMAAKTAGYDYAYFGDGSQPEFIDDKFLKAGKLAKAMLSLTDDGRSEWLGAIHSDGCVVLYENEDDWKECNHWYVCTADYAEWLHKRHEVKGLINRICR